MGLAACLLAACAPPVRLPDARALDFLLPPPAIGTGQDLGPVALTGLGGGSHAPRLGLVQHDGVPSLTIIPGDRPLTALRPVQANLLVTPYLTWSWNVVPTPDGGHPLSVVVVFGSRGGTPEAAGSLPTAWPPPATQPALVIVWDRGGLRRGALERAPDVGANAVRYAIRTGMQDGGTWWVETVDLGAIYRHAWPDRPLRDATVALLGVAVGPGPAEAPAYVAGVVLSR